MDIELLAAWGEFVGGISGVISAVAMIASLVFVGLQVRQHTRAIRSSTRSEIALGQIDTNYRLAENPTLLAAGYGLLKGEDTSAQDRLMGAQVLSGVFRALENQYFAYKEGNFSESIWEGYKQNLIWNVSQVNFYEFWEDRRLLFSTEFAAYIDELKSTG